MRRLLSALCLSAALVAPAIADDTELTALGPLDPALAPRASMQIAGARIGWRMDDLRAAFRAAALDGQPVVVATEGDDGGLFANVLRCPTFNSLAGKAHFVLIPLPVTDDSSDAARVVDALHIDPNFSSPVAVIDMTGAQVNERLRVNGYVDEATLLAKLASAGLIANHNPLPLDRIALGGKPPGDCER